MGWQEFLVFADASEDGVARLRMAMNVAKAFDGKLEALVLARGREVRDLALLAELREALEQRVDVVATEAVVHLLTMRRPS